MLPVDRVRLKVYARMGVGAAGDYVNQLKILLWLVCGSEFMRVWGAAVYYVNHTRSPKILQEDPVRLKAYSCIGTAGNMSTPPVHLKCCGGSNAAQSLCP